MNPIDAVTHPDPYPYYADLVAHKPLYFDAALGYWIASGAAAVRSVLTSTLCRVRPVKEPVPTALISSSAGEVFGHLMRMNDGGYHDRLKLAAASALGSVDQEQVRQLTSRGSRFLYQPLRPDQLTDFAFQLPQYVIASLLGVPDEQLAQATSWIRDFVGAMAAGSDQNRIDQGSTAADHLRDLFESLLAEQRGDSLLNQFNQAVKPDDEQAKTIIDNAIGFLSQTYEATAALIGNTLLALSRHDDVYQQVRLNPDLLKNVVLEVLRFDAPVQNTRRFVAQEGIVAGEKLHEGDMILVILAAANRDASINHNPYVFDIFRAERQIFTFGNGYHACPGTHLAATIASTGIEMLLASGLEINALHNATVTYQPSGNIRMAMLHQEKAL